MLAGAITGASTYGASRYWDKLKPMVDSATSQVRSTVSSISDFLDFKPRDIAGTYVCADGTVIQCTNPPGKIGFGQPTLPSSPFFPASYFSISHKKGRYVLDEGNRFTLETNGRGKFAFSKRWRIGAFDGRGEVNSNGKLSLLINMRQRSGYCCTMQFTGFQLPPCLPGPKPHHYPEDQQAKFVFPRHAVLFWESKAYRDVVAFVQEQLDGKVNGNWKDDGPGRLATRLAVPAKIVLLEKMADELEKIYEDGLLVRSKECEKYQTCSMPLAAQDIRDYYLRYSADSLKYYEDAERAALFYRLAAKAAREVWTIASPYEEKRDPILSGLQEQLPFLSSIPGVGLPFHIAITSNSPPLLSCLETMVKNSFAEDVAKGTAERAGRDIFKTIVSRAVKSAEKAIKKKFPDLVGRAFANAILNELIGNFSCELFYAGLPEDVKRNASEEIVEAIDQSKNPRAHLLATPYPCICSSSQAPEYLRWRHHMETIIHSALRNAKARRTWMNQPAIPGSEYHGAASSEIVPPHLLRTPQSPDDITGLPGSNASYLGSWEAWHSFLHSETGSSPPAFAPAYAHPLSEPKKLQKTAEKCAKNELWGLPAPVSSSK